jgi:hypothetical protein
LWRYSEQEGCHDEIKGSIRLLLNAEPMIFQQRPGKPLAIVTHTSDKAAEARFDSQLSHDTGDPLAKATGSIELKPRLILTLAIPIDLRSAIKYVGMMQIRLRSNRYFSVIS